MHPLPSTAEVPIRLVDQLRAYIGSGISFVHTGHEQGEQRTIEREIFNRLRTGQKQLDLYELLARQAYGRPASTPLEFTLGTCPLCQQQMRYRTYDGSVWEGVGHCPAEPATEPWAEISVTSDMILLGPNLHSLLPNPILDQTRFEAEALRGIAPGSPEAATRLLQRYAKAGALAVPVRHHACLASTTVPDQRLLFSPGLEREYLAHPSRVTATTGNRVVMIIDGARRAPAVALPPGTVCISCRPGRYRFTIQPEAYSPTWTEKVFGSLTRMPDDFNANNNPD